MVKNDDELILTIGSKYFIRSIYSREKPLDTEGTFVAYTMIGQDIGFVIQRDDGAKRVVPSHMILSIDILESAEEKENGPEEKAGS